MKLHLIMPMGGGGTRFGNAGYEVPKPLIGIYGRPFFYWAARSLAKFVDLGSLTFVVLRDHVERFAIGERIKEYFPEARIVEIPKVLPGAVMTCLAGCEAVPPGEPILFNDCDHLFVCRAFNDFCAREAFGELDGGLLTFRSTEDRFSYAQCDGNGFVSRTVEKEVLSELAICGAYYFKSREIFSDAAESYMKNCRYKEFFVSGVYNVLAENGGRILPFETDRHVSFGTPEEYEAAMEDDTYRQLL